MLRPARLPRCLEVVLVAGLALASAMPGARSAELELPVPNGVVYPGKSPIEGGVRDRPFRVKDSKLHLYVTERAALRDRVARRTLVAGRPIKRSDLEKADTVEAGAEVSLIYREAGLVITGVGTALASAQPGETLRVRNTDSGRMISGKVAPDGSVHVSQ